ncbi:MAG: 30S ribosome-binding factor RbfA [Acidobacteria bacterium]|nr:30S ribosome-binding factor RbfA [Acidobacteriota bacterium]
MSSQRMDKISSLIQATLSEIIAREVKDPRIEWATITRVKVSPDLRTARISISTIKDQEHLTNMIIALNKMRGFLQNRLNDSIRMKYIPVLHFYPDKNIPYAFEIMEKISEVVPEIIKFDEEDEQELDGE